MRTPALLVTLAVVAAASSAAPAWAQRSGAVDVGPYLMHDRAAEVALARTAAPRAISNSATVMVLGRSGFVDAVRGTNGFTCLVVRSLSDPLTSTTRWNPKSLAPHCFNPPASRTVLPTVLKQTEWVIAGLTNDEIIQRFDHGYATHEFVPPEAGAMTYMLSPQQTLGANNSHWVPHLMFYYERSVSPSTWGIGDSVTTIINGSAGDPNATVLMLLIPVRRWSNGELAMDR